MAKILAQGTTFQFTDSQSTPALQVVGEIIDYSGFDGEASEQDETTLASTAKEFGLGLQDHGGFTINLFYDRDDLGQAAMHAARASRLSKQCVLTLSDGKTATFDALVKSFPINGAQDEKVKSTVTLRVTGDVVWA